ncbi:hypothetical protein BOX15_Mlig001257g3 [Macrostomum lignano]|uniref:PRELI/MSF1 domain-containing protein n=1 Tax=Macrostomum lignano TaxID=282301 RepID=A0A267H984_9PLAT|nr:hypothetical protein BOX15_Mlig001257g3 [Macrostomum lignano]
MRIWKTEHTFEHSWETVVQAAVRKYPNPHNASIVSQDVVTRELTSDGRLRTHRLFGTNFSGVVQRMQSLGFGRLVRMFADDDAEVWYGSEHTVVDPARRNYRLQARNLTLSANFTMDEQLEYLPHPDCPESRTLLKQSVTIRCPWWPFGGLVETMLEELVYSKMASKGPMAIEWVIANRDFKLPPPLQPPAKPSEPSLPTPAIDFNRLCQAMEAGMQQVGAEVKHLTKLVVDEHFLIM